VSLRDPSGRAVRVAATSISAAVPNTDFKLSSVSGSGTDLNGNLVAAYELNSDVVTVTLTNTSASNGFLWFYHIQGLGVYLYEPRSTTIQTGQPDGETLRVEMVYQDDNNVGEDIANLLNFWFSVDQSDDESVMFIAKDQPDGYAFCRGSMAEVTEGQTHQ
jgi:hypothetical protein